MWFQKKKAPPAVKPEDLRAQYRKRPSKSQRVEVKLSVEGWDPLQVELIDLSVRGAGVRVPFQCDRNLRKGDVVELSIGTQMRSEVTTAAKVVFARADGETHIRYGFEFLNLGQLYSQLDALYARLFNRRKHRRVIPALDRRTPVTLAWNGGDVRGHVFDLSTHGIGVTLTRDGASRVAHIDRFEVRFALPDTPGELHGFATVQHRTPYKSQVLLGLAIDMDGEDGLSAHEEAISAYVERREAEISRWEA